MSARIEEIRQENRGGDVSYRDIEWLCSVASAAERVLLFHGGRKGIDELSAPLAELRRALGTANNQERPA